MEEVELGGLEDEEDDTLAAGIEEEEEFLFDKEVSFISQKMHTAMHQTEHLLQH